jgi:hypothetical protein
MNRTYPAHNPRLYLSSLLNISNNYFVDCYSVLISASVPLYAEYFLLSSGLPSNAFGGPGGGGVQKISCGQRAERMGPGAVAP